MKTTLQEITIRDLISGYKDRGAEGVTGYSGRLNIRPAFQREYIYNEKQAAAVIRSIMAGLPINSMYWSINADGVTYELVDGQQRTASICKFVTGTFSVENMFFNNMLQEEQEQILDYKLLVYICAGTEREKLDWFRTINIAGVAMTEQELLNATYSGPFIEAAKRYFSQVNCPAKTKAGALLKGSPIRQDYLATVLKWISDGKVEEYLSQHQHDDNADELWQYFQNVIWFINDTFKETRPIMKGVNWGKLFNEFGTLRYDSTEMEAETVRLLMDDDVTKKSGIYPYLLTGEEKYLSIRAFTDNQKQTMFDMQQGVCPLCGETFEFDQMEADHITPWSEGGKTSIDNGQLLCRYCNRHKSNK